jgi:hypothetical protein
MTSKKNKIDLTSELLQVINQYVSTNPNVTQQQISQALNKTQFFIGSEDGELCDN